MHGRSPQPTEKQTPHGSLQASDTIMNSSRRLLQLLPPRMASLGGMGRRPSPLHHHPSPSRMLVRYSSKSAGKPFSLRYVYSAYEMEGTPEPEEIVKFKTVNSAGKSITLKHIKRTLSNNYGMDIETELKTLEYYENGEWSELTDVSQVAGKQAIPVRTPESFDQEEYDEDYDDEGYDPTAEGDDGLGGDFASMAIGDQVRELVDKLKVEKYVYSTKSLQLKDASGNVIMTKAFVLQAAEDDEELRNTLLTRIGALDHIVNAIHYPFLWKEEQEQEEDESV